MRLLNVSTLRLESFTDERTAPPYAILSHTWDDEEILFEDVERLPFSTWTRMKGFRKLNVSAQQAQKDGYRYVWIDTCCIDKGSSAELSEAINSMFSWYACAKVCYAYLIDVDKETAGAKGRPYPRSPGDHVLPQEPTQGTSSHGIQGSRWFKRGWTLQELVAPSHIRFYDRNWQNLGSRETLAGQLADITGIDRDFLSRSEGGPRGFGQTPISAILTSFSVATRMVWASKRETTRLEDTAYCLLGIFGVNMPLLYGEGEKAFRRLQEEIIKNSTDTSILAYTEKGQDFNLLASHPRSFHMSPAVWTWGREMPRMLLGQHQITVDMVICPTFDVKSRRNIKHMYFGVFDCTYADEALFRPAILIQLLSANPLTFMRREHSELFLIGPNSDVAFTTALYWGYTQLSGLEYGVRTSEATRATITLRAQSQRSEWCSLPTLFIQPLSQDLNHEYYVDDSVPSRNGMQIAHEPVYSAHGVTDITHGILSFFDGHHSRFLMTWGTTGTSPMSQAPWCKLFSLEDVIPFAAPKEGEHWDYDEPNIETRIHRLFQDFRELNQGRDLAPDLENIDSLEVWDEWPHTVNAEIGSASFLDSTTFALSITVTPLQIRDEQSLVHRPRSYSAST
ncbi:heterokaryon incompatibility protein-domain-containing protein [Xylariaceae sp. FL1272]|nr:heterokaryon incompatibility protein-domain-containing protein [Xylariaceae sp. FL1272]